MAGRSGTIYLGDAIADGGYEISYDMLGKNGFCTIGDEFTVGTNAARVAAAAAKYTWFIPWAKCSIDPGGGTRVATPGAPQWTDAEVLSLYSIVAAAHDAVWATGGGVDQNWVTSAPPLSRATIVFPQGSYAVNFPILTCYGTYLGAGPSQYANAPNDANQTTYGTRLFLDNTNWIDNASPEHYIFRSVNFIEEVGGVLYGGINGNVTYANQLATYLEGCEISGFRLEGSKASQTYDAGYHASGIAMLRLGSCSKVMRNQCDNFNDAGIELVGGTPATLDTNRTFFNNRYGVWIRGAAQCFVFSHEADENPAVFGVTAYDTATHTDIIEAGCHLSINGVKMETGTQGNAYRKGQMFLDAEGWVCGSAMGVDYVGVASFPECLIRIKPTLNTSFFAVYSLKVFGYVRTLVHHADGADSRKWFLDEAEYTKKWASSCHAFIYNSVNGGSLMSLTGHAPRQLDVPYENKMMWLDESGGNPVAPLWDDSVNPGTPVWHD
jgi:hypothetical protein